METIMKIQPSPSVILAFRPLTERVFAGISDALRAALRVPQTLWCGHKVRSRQARAMRAISDMNEHTLRDIGAPDRLISHAAARSRAHHRRQISLQLLVSLLAGALIATATPTSAEATHAQTMSKARTQEGMVGVFTGEFVDGAPVYRLPSVIVVAARKVELVKMEREEQATRAKEARTRAAARRCALTIC
jgi:hypothetical protein